MNASLPAWECECGTVEYGRFPPEECGDCGESNSFVLVPEDMRDEAEEDHLLGKLRDDNWEDD